MFFQSDAGQIYYEVNGPDDAPVIVFTHGATLNHGMFNAQVAALKERFRVVTWDMPGHGGSAPLNENLDLSRMADYVTGIMDEIKAEKAVMAGQSLGSWVAQHVAIIHPERVTAVVSIGGTPLDKPVTKTELVIYRVMLAISRMIPVKTLVNRIAKSKAVTLEAQQFAEEAGMQIGKDKEQYFRIIAGMLDTGNIQVTNPPRKPLLITHGEYEMPKYVIKVCRKWHSRVPESRYAELPDAGHNANQDNPDEFNRVLVDFLNEVL